jgi:hypothetical protein
MSLKVISLLATLVATASADLGTCVCAGCAGSETACGGATDACATFGGVMSSCLPFDNSLTCSNLFCSNSPSDETNCANSCTSIGCSGEIFVCGASPSSKSTCFPATATVQLESGATVAMADLQIGDAVLAAPGVYSKVYMFSHRLAESKAKFVTIATTSATLKLTPDHYLYVNGTLATAQTVRVGDLVTLADGSKTPVTKVSAQWAAGLYNPHTMHGDIVVDGVQTSTYTQGIAPAVAHAALWPVRALFAAGVEVGADTFAQGSELLAQLLPNGQEKY